MATYHKDAKGNEVITLSTSLCVILLAMIAAVFSQPTADLVLESDRNLFLPPFFKQEGFYRAFLINLSFAGITTAATSLYRAVPTTFWIVRDPMLTLFLNLFIGTLASFTLEAEASPPKNKCRFAWLATLLCLGIISYGLSVWAVLGAVEPKAIHG